MLLISGSAKFPFRFHLSLNGMSPFAMGPLSGPLKSVTRRPFLSAMIVYEPSSTSLYEPALNDVVIFWLVEAWQLLQARDLPRPCATRSTFNQTMVSRSASSRFFTSAVMAYESFEK